MKKHRHATRPSKKDFWLNMAGEVLSTLAMGIFVGVALGLCL